MNSKERFHRVMCFEKPDRFPFYEWLGFWRETINRWYSEGLPWSIETKASDLGLGIDYFGHDPRTRIVIDVSPIPYFVTKTLHENSRYIVRTNYLGVTEKSLKTGTSMPTWIDFPVKTPEDFEKIKERLNPKDVRRYPKNWSLQLIEQLNSVKCPVYIHTRGFFDQLRSRFMGLERLLVSFYKNPGFIHEMLDFWVDFLIEVTREVVENVKLDFFSFGEDIAYRNGPFISPELFRRFILPCYLKVTRFLRDNGVKTIMVDSDGNPEKLIPLFLEGGVNCLWPLEVESGMDAVKLREKYGRHLRLIGNIDKRVFVKGKTAIKKEVEAKVPLFNEGGYIPSVDHALPSNVPLSNYIYYVDLLKAKCVLK